MSGRTSRHQNLVSIFPGIDNCLAKCQRADCLPYAVGKQPSIPLINLGRKWMLKWWWSYSSILDSFNIRMHSSSLDYMLLIRRHKYFMYSRKLGEKKKQEDYEETEADSARVTAQELEDAWEDELEAFTPASRITGNLKLISSFQNYLSRQNYRTYH